jgi:putative membrane protein
MRNTPALALGFTLALLASTSLAVAKSDKEFVKDAIQGNLGEISLGQMAQNKGNSQGIKSFGTMLVTDHSASNEKAMTLAKSLNVTPPTEPKKAAQSEQDKLSKLSGKAFDKEFAHYMVMDHKKDIAEFEKEAKSGGGAAQFAKNTLPTLHKHLDTAQSLASGQSTSN